MTKMYCFYFFALSLMILHIPVDSSAEQEQVSVDSTVKTGQDQQDGTVTVIEQDGKVDTIDEKTRGLQETLIPILQGVGGKILTAAVDKFSGASDAVALQTNVLFITILGLLLACTSAFN